MAIALLFGSPAQAVPIVIDFDSESRGAIASNQFSGLGVTFVDAVIISSGGFSGSSGSNSIYHASNGYNADQDNPIKVLFDFSVSDVSLTGVDVGSDGFILKAFDAVAGGNLVDEQQVTGITADGIGEYFILSVAGISIRRVEFSQILSGNFFDGMLFDDLTFSAVSTVPVPAALPLFGTGLALMGFLGWRRKRKAA